MSDEARLNRPSGRNRWLISGQIPVRGLQALRWSFGIAFVLAWNALNLLALYFNGGWGRYHDPRSFLVLALTTASTSGLFFAIALSPRFRNLVTEPKRRDRYEATPFVFIGVVVGLFAVVLAYELFASYR